MFHGFTVGVDDESGGFAIEGFTDGEDFSDFFVDGATGEAGACVGVIPIAAESGGEGFRGGV